MRINVSFEHNLIFLKISRLELSEEKILLLESRVDTLKKEKQMDLDNFSLTMEQTKQVYDEALQKALMDEANRN